MATPSKDYSERPCKNPRCKVIFKPTRAWQEFHSEACRRAYHNLGVTECPECGAVFERKDQ
jgi:uncharacterized C2H2 Zn-finger protein